MAMAKPTFVTGIQSDREGTSAFMMALLNE
jgi:hypothetical protein